MKKIKTLIIATLSLLMLAGCSGEFHTHKWEEANFQNPSMCSVCGATKGLPLTAGFEKHELQAQLKLNEPAQYHTVCGEEELDTTGVLTVTETTTFEEDETHKRKNGYEWTVVRMLLVVGDDVSNEYGFDFNYLITDYYDIEGLESSFIYDEESGYNTFTVNWYGKDYAECQLMVKTAAGEWRKEDGVYKKEVEITWYILLPQGYDGIVIGLRNSKIKTDGMYYIYQYYDADDFLLYRVGKANEENPD